jgi:hypothetical protein
MLISTKLKIKNNKYHKDNNIDEFLSILNDKNKNVHSLFHQ